MSGIFVKLKLHTFGMFLYLYFISLLKNIFFCENNIKMKSTKVHTLGTIWLKCSNIWIENIFACNV